MSEPTKYMIHLEPQFDFLELIDVPALVEACEEDWYNQTLCRLNDSVIRLGILKGEFHWHKHDQEDEFFFVLDGDFLIDLEGETISLARHQGYTVPKGVVHRTRAPERTVVLMVEKSSVRPTGDE
jgi:mannose-6-phosphate isomerase-like protein (cupin superfamily)